MKRRRSFWKYLEVLARATIIADIRKKRIAREYQESWGRENRKFIKKLERERDRKLADSSKWFCGGYCNNLSGSPCYPDDDFDDGDI